MSINLPEQPVPVAVTLDVSNLEKSCRFYEQALGFAIVTTHRPGMIFEQRGLRSPLHPGFELRLRGAFGKRPIGSGGGMHSVVLRYPDLADRVARLADTARWIGERPPLPFEGNRVQFADPDGYTIELFR